MALSKLTILNDRYVLRNTLGEPGHYDETYLAWNLMKNEAAVVVREFSPAFLMERSANGAYTPPQSGPAERLFDYGLNCFLREAEASALIDHPNVIQHFHSFKENGTAYSVSAYHAGATLAEVLQGQEGKIQERAAFAIIIPLLDGLMAGHRKGLIHGRLSPQHIFLTKSGRPMLFRFHVTQILLARRCGRVEDVEIPGFTAPELLRRDGQKGPWSDVYSCGATLYSIITGQNPPAALSRFDHDVFPDLLRSGNLISKDLQAVILKAMAMNRNERFQTIQELKDALIAQMQAAESRVHSKPVTEATFTAPPVQEPAQSSEQLFLKAQADAQDLASLSQKALEKAQVENAPVERAELNTDKPLQTEPLEEHNKAPIALSLEDIDSERASEWLPKLDKEQPAEGDGSPYTTTLEPDLSTPDLAASEPFIQNEVTYLAPRVEDAPVVAHETETESPSPILQVVTSATANRTRILFMAAVTSCIILFSIVGVWSYFSGPQPAEITEASATPPPTQSFAATPSSASGAAAALLFVKADSLEDLASQALVTGDTALYFDLSANAFDVYQDILKSAPGDSAALTKMRALNENARTLSRPRANTPPASAALSAENQQKLAAGDSLFALKQYDAAKTQFEAVLTEAPENGSVLQKIQAVEAALTEQANVSLNRAFARLVRQGEAAMKENLLQEAETAFVEAQKLKPRNRSVNILLNNTREKLEQQSQSQAQYEKLKSQGDELFSQQSFSAALITYESAQILRPDDLYLEEQIKKVKSQLKEMESIVKERDSQFEMHRNQADSHFAAGNLTEALTSYRIAQALNPNDAHVNTRISSINNSSAVQVELATDDEGIFTLPETMPEMLDQAGTIKRIVYPAEARNNKIEGKVFVKMLVDEEGKVSRLEVVKGIGFGCDREALRVMRRATFKPATYGGKPVKAWHTYPIMFKIID